MRLDRWEDFDSRTDREEIDCLGAEAFLQAHPSFFQSEWNGEILVAWCRSRGIPATHSNLSAAYAELKRDGLLEIPTPEALPPKKPETDAFINALAKDTEAELKALEKLRDDPLLSDQTRKKRDFALKRLAIASRLANRQGVPLRGSERIVI